MEQKFVCVCGKSYDTVKKLSAHQAGCRQFYISRDGTDDVYIQKLKNIGANARALRERKEKEFIEQKNKCEACGKIMPHKYASGRFCCRSCANKRNHTAETKEKIRFSVIKYAMENSHSYSAERDDVSYIVDEDESYYIKRCAICGREFKLNRLNRKRKTCSTECFHKLISKNTKARYSNRSEYKKYKSACTFTFWIYDYPEEFNTELIEQYGFYKALNHGDNQDGVSRDHMISVKYGYENEIDPYLISHPANCELMLQPDNMKKNSGASIDIQELLHRITKWEKKHGKYENKIDYSGIERFNKN